MILGFDGGARAVVVTLGLGDMATQVVRTILNRAARYGRLNRTQVSEVEEIERHSQFELSVVLQKLGHAERLALFDMDGTLLKGRFIVNLAQRTNKTAELSRFLDNPELTSEERTRRIASLFEGVAQTGFTETARTMPLNPGSAETIVALRKLGYRVGIVTDSYQIAAEIVRRRVFADFSIAHLMRFHKGRATGRITLSPAMSHPDGCRDHSLCKVNVMHHLLEKMNLTPSHVLAVGDGDNDECLLRAAGQSIAFHPKSSRVEAAGKNVIPSGPLSDLLQWIRCEHRDAIHSEK